MPNALESGRVKLQGLSFYLSQSRVGLLTSDLLKCKTSSSHNLLCKKTSLFSSLLESFTTGLTIIALKY